DIGGSMDDHIRLCEELFSAARGEFKHLEYYYFHNCVYEGVWKDNKRRNVERLSTFDVINTYAADYKLVFVGDASMSPYEITQPGGSVEHFNEEAGIVWMRRLLDKYPHAIWLNPSDERYWSYTQSIGLLRKVMDDRMYPLTLAGLDAGMRELMR
ncbi:MAG: VWA domain-containing protein, partial [Niveispirillum sp.]|nr:VWA domain-containing protein [Niveispirillum sp.]